VRVSPSWPEQMLTGRIHYSRLVRDQLAKIHLQIGGGGKDTRLAGNPSPTSNSLLTGKRTGNLVETEPAGFLTTQSTSEFSCLQQNSLLDEAGNFCRKNREFERKNSEFSFSTSRGLPRTLLAQTTRTVGGLCRPFATTRLY
jgi:hypothetical protein